MTTIADLVNDVRSRLSGTFTDELNVLGGDYNAGSGSVTLTYDTQFTVGSILSCEENTWYVVAVDSSAARTVRVIPSYDGGPDLDKAAGKVVRVKPRVTDWAMFSHIRDQIMLMSSPANGLGIVDFWMDYGLTQSGMFPPPTGIVPQRIHNVYGSDGQRWWPVTQYDLQVGAVRVWDDRFLQYCFVYSMPFVEATSFSQDAINDIGLSEAMLDIPVLGAAGMLLLTQENRRNQLGSQGDPRRAQEVQAGSNMGSGREMLRMRDQRIGQEYARLLQVVNIAGVGA